MSPPRPRCIHRDDMAVPQDWLRPWIVVVDQTTMLLCDTYEIARATQAALTAPSSRGTLDCAEAPPMNVILLCRDRPSTGPAASIR